MPGLETMFQSSRRAAPVCCVLDMRKEHELPAVGNLPRVTVERQAIDMPIISSTYTRINPAKYPSLKCYISRAMGTDHINAKAFEEAGVPVKKIGDFCSDVIADWVARRITAGHRPPGFPEGPDVEAIKPLTKLAIVGMGRVGTAVRDWALANSIRYVPIHHTDTWPLVHAKLEGVTHVSLHLPATDESKAWVNWEVFFSRLQGAIVLNTARASIVDEDALRRALDEGNVHWAYLDVASSGGVREKSATDDRVVLSRHPRVSYTNHESYRSPESLQRRYAMFKVLLDETIKELGL